MGFLKEIFSSTKKIEMSVLPVYDSFNDAPENSLFRLPKDPSTTVRINQSYPQESLKDRDIIREYWSTSVAGTSHRLENVTSFVYGSQRSIFIEHESSKKYPHALAVYGIWRDERSYSQKKQLGYVPNEEAKEIAGIVKAIPDHTFAAKLNALFLPTKEKYAGIRFDLVVLRMALPRFEIIGVGRDSGRKRKKTYIAKDKEEVILKAQKDGIIVEVNKIKQL